MTRALIAALVLVPLAAGAGLSDFDQPKWALLAVLGVALGAVGLLRRPPTEGPARLLRPLLVAGGVLVLATLLGTAGEPGALAVSCRELAHLALALLVFAIASDERSDRGLVIAGAAAPPLLLAAQALLTLGVNPLEVPHRPGLLTATIGNSGLLAECLVAHVGFALIALRRPGATRALGVLSIGSIVAGVLVADARAGWIALAVALLVVLVGAAPRRRAPRPLPRILALAGLASLVCVATLLGLRALEVGLPDLGARLASAVSDAHPTNRVRLELWKDALDIWREHPIAGVGPGRFAFHHPDHRSVAEWSLSGVASFVRTPHSTPLRLLAETGVLGLLAAAAVLAFVLRLVLRARRSAEEGRAEVAVGALASLAAVVVFALVWFPLRQPATLLPLAVLVGLVGGGERRRAGTFERRAVYALGIAAGLFVLLWIEADAAAISARDRLEATKRALTLTSRQPGADLDRLAREVSEAGADAERCLRVARRGFLGPELRYRLLLGATDVVEERPRLEAAAAGLEDRAAATRLRGATRTFPGDRELLDGLRAAHRLAPRHLLLERLLARTELRLGRKVEVLQRLRTRIERNPATPLLRADLADLYRADAETARENGDLALAASLYDRVRSLLREELRRYPEGPEADAHWETLIRVTGRQGHLLDAARIVEEWIAARGDSALRRSLAGELALRYGETGETLGRFRVAMLPDPGRRETSEAIRQEVAALDGLAPALAHRKLLALLGREPDEVAILSALEGVLAELVAASPDPDVIRIHQRDRKRAIARAKVLYAAEQIESGELRTARLNLRLARRHWPAQGDAWVLTCLEHLRRGDETRAIATLQEWRQTGFDDPRALGVFPDLVPLLAAPELSPWGEETR